MECLIYARRAQAVRKMVSVSPLNWGCCMFPSIWGLCLDRSSLGDDPEIGNLVLLYFQFCVCLKIKPILISKRKLQRMRTNTLTSSRKKKVHPLTQTIKFLEIRQFSLLFSTAKNSQAELSATLIIGITVFNQRPPV